MPFQGSEGFYQGIELAVQATGAAAVADLERHVQALQSQLAGYQAQLKAGTVTTVDAQHEMEKLANDLRQATEAANAANRVMSGMPASLGATQSSARGVSIALLEMSRGFEDFTTGGFLGVLNNIPGSVRGIGMAAGLSTPQVAALETAASLLGTTAYLAYTHWDKLKKLLDDGLGPKLIEDIKSVTAELKELTEKEWKTRVDVSDIEIAKDKLDELTKAKAGFEGLNAPDEATKKRGQVVTQAIVEGSGPGGRKSFTDAVLAATMPAESPEVKAMREKIERLDQSIKEAEEAGDLDRAETVRQIRDQNAGTKEGTQAIEMQNRRAAVERQLGLAAKGDEKQAEWLRKVFEQHPEKFEAQPGVDMQRLGAGLEMASGKDPATGQSLLFAEERRKAAEAQAKKDQAAQAHIDATRNAELDHDIDENLATGPALGQQNKERRRDKAAQDERVRVAEGEADNMVRGIDHEADEAHKKAVNKLTPGVEDQLELAINTNRLAQATRDPSMRREADVRRELEARVGHDLRQTGQDPALAQGIVNKAFEDANTKYTAAFAQTGNNVQALIQLNKGILAHMDSIMHRQQGQSDQIHALMDTHGRMRRRPVFRQNRGAIIIGTALALGAGAANASDDPMVRLAQRQANLEARVSLIGANMNRGQLRAPSLLNR